MGRLLHRWRLYGVLALTIAVTMVIVACGGDAATPEAAILQHGNEADAAAGRYRDLPADDRAALLAFLDSL